MTSPQTVRILSLDGGGMRGVLSATFLKRFCQDAGIPPHQLYNTFDIITGTSIGGIQALGYANGQSPDDMLQFFASKGASIFYYNSVLPLSAYKFSVIMGLPTYPTTFYGQAPLKQALEEVFGTTMTLANLSGKVIIPAWDAHEDDSAIFSNITGLEPFMTGATQDKANPQTKAAKHKITHSPPLSIEAQCHRQTRSGSGHREVPQCIKKRINTVIVFLDNESVLIARILAPFFHQMTAALTIFSEKDLETLTPHTLINLINHSFLGRVGFLGFDQPKARLFLQIIQCLFFRMHVLTRPPQDRPSPYTSPAQY